MFEDAAREQAERGDESKLHLIILDEVRPHRPSLPPSLLYSLIPSFPLSLPPPPTLQVDSILSKRSGSPSQGYRDTVVNQLLSTMDGVNALHNVLVVGACPSFLPSLPPSFPPYARPCPVAFALFLNFFLSLSHTHSPSVPPSHPPSLPPPRHDQSEGSIG